MNIQHIEQWLCFRCVLEPFLSFDVSTTGEIAVCSYCGKKNQCWPIELLADRIEQAFEDHYVRTPTEPDDWQQSLLRDSESDYEWDRDGEPVREAIEGAAQIPDDAVSDVLEILGDRHFDFDTAAMGVEYEFSPESHYERKNSNDSIWQYEWRCFEKTLKTEARYFSRGAADHLAAVFGGIDELSTSDGKPVVVDVGPSAPINMLFRARVFQSEERLKEALCRPDRHLGSPPARAAATGRMNARGISVFYGATSQSVALAEVRPPVGSYVALAPFKIIRPLRLLDISALEKAADYGSIFDPALLARTERAVFLQSLSRIMTRPVMPDDQEFDYLATQAVADFLATENLPMLDGILFKSTQSTDGDNIVLFHKASRVKSMDLPTGVKLNAETVSWDSDGGYPEYNVWEQVPVPDEAEDSPKLRPWAVTPPSVREDEDMREDTLDVIPTSVEVHHVKRVKVECDAHLVTRHRRQEVDSALSSSTRF
ncbi:RES family NAD+ phosphorylase [Pseudomonas alvandae]|uniref:RES family NAD+ phosphorylase n=1 Tax=Pseudomonas canavaninivorans TaxID=2842348 RepID=UPI00215FB402|nr:RES family NAD+ phosphorylase [Pseudomonas canavaninivorans]UVM74016.1 RES family NAD+ phosphorylase [Pseudomonas canavaninivorans]